MENLAYQEEPRTEILNGEIFLMSPRPTVNHNWIADRIFIAFSNCLEGKDCIAFCDETDVYLTKNDRVIPDVMIVCNKNIIEKDGLHGPPDLIVEVLSPSTAKNDRGYKKDLYEKSGVGEYWIVDPKLRSIETYLLADGKYRLNERYIFSQNCPANVAKALRKDCIPVSIYNDFSIPLEKIFRNLL